MNLGFMQGRLVDSEKKNKIQYFPLKNWKKEIKIASSIPELKTIEWTVNIGNIYNNPLFNKKKLPNISKALKENKILLNSVTCDFFMERPFFKNKKSYFNLKNLKNIINNGLKIGIKYFVIPLVDNSSIDNLREENFLISIFKKKIIPLFKNKKGMILFEIDYQPNLIIPFLKKFKSSKVGINYDSGNSASLDYSMINEVKYFNHVKNVHIKDRLKHGKTVPLGIGNCNFKKLIKILKKNQYKGNLILQTARSPSNRHVYEINKNIKFLKKFL